MTYLSPRANPNNAPDMGTDGSATWRLTTSADRTVEVPADTGQGPWTFPGVADGLEVATPGTGPPGDDTTTSAPAAHRRLPTPA